MSDLKNEWKDTGVALGHAFKDLGKSIVKTVRVGIDKADDWANSSDAPKDAPSQEPPKDDTQA